MSRIFLKKSVYTNRLSSDIMAIENIAMLTCCLLAISFAMAQTEKENLTVTPTTTPGLNITTFITVSNVSANATTASHVTEDTTPFTRTQDNKTLNETTSPTQTSESTTNMTNITTSLMTTPGTYTPATTFTTEIQTTTGYKSTLNTTVITTASGAITKTTGSEEIATQGLGLNISEKSMTIAFSVILGLFAIGLVVLIYNKCKHKFQYLHQPLNNTNDTDVFVADDDTLVISGGLYDGHPIYGNIPTASSDQSQFRLEFLN